jgi:hypothetical protein
MTHGAAPFVAALFLALFGGTVVATAVADRRGLIPGEAVYLSAWAPVLTAGLSLGAAAVHFAVIGEHFAEYPPYGLVFALLAWFQSGWAVAYVARPHPRLAVTAMAVNLAAVIVWLTSRTVGLPFGPERWVPEAVGAADTLASGLESLLTLGLVVALVPGLGVRGRLPAPAAVAYVGAALLGIGILTTLVIASMGPEAHVTAR